MTDEITLDAPETPLERFLAAAAGMDGITLDEPVTRIEKYLYKIAQNSGGVPAVEDADKGKYLHANESTGDIEWATAGGSGGGRFVVTFSYNEGTETWSTDKTFAECVAAWEAGNNLFALAEGTYYPMSFVTTDNGDVTYIAFYSADAESHYIFGYGISADGAYYYSGD